MKNEWKKVIHQFKQQHQRKVGKGNFTELFGQAYKSVFDPETIKAVFQMKPSEPTSIKGAFPLLQPSPVRAVMAAFHHYKPTAVDLDPETYTAASLHSLSTQSAGPPPVEAFPTYFGSSSRASLSDWSNRDPNIDLSLYTPSKQMHMMTDALSLTSSGSFLVQPDIRITSRYTIAPPVLEGPPDLCQPDWSKAMIQNMFVEKQSISLNTKENKKLKNNTKVSMKSKGRHLTGDEFRTEVEDAEKAKKKKETDKKKKKNVRETAKNVREELETC
ncbi:hypothetical protein EV421DRAFT_1743282 [Armillaria borealis]|uniref:Uncharacterized protein n=1 Tax=Armillaria borealis TaxID=47425 RepID=A0AA39MEX0_9AGAR|nr:hypothetical protein EV421DRAFT_1743282 [Armillaria borealis]